MALVQQGAPPNPKRTTHSSGKNKACIILCCLDRKRITDDQITDITSMEYNICIVDLNSDVVGVVDEDDGFTLVSPTFQIDCGADKEYPYVSDAFCVLGQTLYVFEGSSEKPHAPSRKSVFALDLTRTQTLTQRTTKLAKGGPLLEKIGDMTVPKSSPAALPTPEGDKIVVFSRRQYTFELFEPANRSWERLPSVPGHEEMRYSIRAYGFVQDSSNFLVQTDLDGGLYALDLASSADIGDRHWVKVGTIYSGVERIPCGGAFFETVEEGRFCFVNSSGLHDLEEHVGEYDSDHFSLGFVPRHPLGGRGGEDSSSTSLNGNYYAALLNYNGDGEGECDFCHMEMEGPEDYRSTQWCRTEINVCRVDLKSYKEKADQLSLGDLRWSPELKYSETRIVRTLRFSLCFEGICRLWEHHLFFTF